MRMSEYQKLLNKVIGLQEDIDRIYMAIREQTNEMYDISDRLGDLWRDVVAVSEITPDEDTK